MQPCALSSTATLHEIALTARGPEWARARGVGIRERKTGFEPATLTLARWCGSSVTYRVVR